MKTEIEFLNDLEKVTSERQRLVQTELIPTWAKGLGDWLAVNPWRVLVPISLIVYGSWRIAGGQMAKEFMLGLFGGFAR